ncbi:TPA: hypothetical protein DCR49_02570 [Candidatus Delongbacteria bacterium]|nr:MAG: hypothetical protein A2Y39_07710 [Candidatus Delongbacteria bacterium GWF2_40_14]HAQ60879.1 hypothetical protein [Candidatus Delongbacteria bacterium]
MKLAEIKEILQAEILTTEFDPELDIEIGCSSDLMSDILAFAQPGSVLVTSLINVQVINTANIADIKVVCFVMDKDPHQSIITHAEKNSIAVLKTKFTTFECCGLLYMNGLKSCNYTKFDNFKTYII